jgi:hypothetical protein
MKRAFLLGVLIAADPLFARMRDLVEFKRLVGE